VEKPEGRRPLGRPRCRWVNDDMIDLVKVGWGDVGLSLLIIAAQARVVGSELTTHVPLLTV
jgi:hypothetical protein